MSMSDQYDDGRYDPGFGYGLPITAPRGGIKYPKRTQETHMAPKDTSNHAVLQKMLDLRSSLDREIREMVEKIEKDSYPPAPPKEFGDMFFVDVRFVPRGKVYRFMLLRTPSGWYSTAVSVPDNRFNDWESLVSWLRRPEVHWHGPIFQLESTGRAVMDAERRG